MLSDIKEYIKNNKLDGITSRLKANSVYWAEITAYCKDFSCINKSEMIYLYLNQIEKQPICICGSNKKLKFISIVKGYNQFCQSNCTASWENRRKKVKEHGKKFGLANKDAKEKQEATLLKRKGIRNPGELSDHKEKIIKTNLKKYGVENWMKDSSHIKQMKCACYEKYGVDHLMKDPKYVKKLQENYYKKYGIINPSQRKDVKVKISDSIKKSFFSNISSRTKNKVIPLFTYEEYNGVIRSNKYLWKCTKCHNEFNDVLDDGHIPRCKRCYPVYPNGKSKKENKIITFLRSINLTEFSVNDTTLTFPKEIDILFYNKKIAIEYCGLFFHSEFGFNKRGKYYHLDKLKVCEKNGYQLITIFEDEFLDNSELVYNTLKNKLGVLEKGIFSKKCNIKEISWKEAKEFLDKHHIQKAGYRVKINIAAMYKNKIVAVMSFGLNINDKNILEIKRYATNGKNNPGVASKLFNYFLNKYNPDKVLSYVDRRWSQGNLYYKLGFKLDKIIPPSCWYLKDYKSRLHRSNFTKDIIRKKFGLNENYEFKEMEVMNEHGYDRIWDCGNLRFIYEK